jgi:hypothetical protein
MEEYQLKYNNKVLKFNNLRLTKELKTRIPTGSLLNITFDNSDLTDISGNHYDATTFDADELNALTYTSGKVSNCLVLPNRLRTGIKATIGTTDIWAEPHNMTIGFWIKDPSVNSQIMAAGTSGSNLVPIISTDASGILNIQIFNSIPPGTWDNFAGTKNICDGNWHLIVYTKVSYTHNIYLDASQGNIEAGGSNLTTLPSGSDIYFGCGYDFSGGDHGFATKIDQCVMYNSQLSETDRMKLWQNGTGI